jgi:hypothetical protein
MCKKAPGDIPVVGAFICKCRQLNDITIGPGPITVNLDANAKPTPEGCGNDRVGVLQGLFHKLLDVQQK